jgi:hypothetical protein
MIQQSLTISDINLKLIALPLLQPISYPDTPFISTGKPSQKYEKAIYKQVNNLQTLQHKENK